MLFIFLDNLRFCYVSSEIRKEIFREIRPDDTSDFETMCDDDDVDGRGRDELVETPEALKDFAMEVYDVIRDIRDPEKPETLEELNVLTEESVAVRYLDPSIDERLVRYFQ